jgi:hypothetical protein
LHGQPVGGLSARGAFCSGSSIDRTGFFTGALIVSQELTGVHQKHNQAAKSHSIAASEKGK